MEHVTHTASKWRSRTGLTGFSTGVILALASYTAGVSADDTEVFFGQVDSSGNTAPNVLFILDTSGSMGLSDFGQSGTRLSRMKSAMKEIFEQTTNVNVGLMSLNGSYGGGPVLYPVTPIDQSACQGTACTEVLLRNSIDDVDNDTEQLVANGRMQGGGFNLSVGGQEGPGGAEQIVGLRFDDLGIPQGARIVSATLEMDSVYDNDGPASITLYGEDADDADAFNNARNNLSNRQPTQATSSFDPGAWEADASYESPDISGVIQEIVNRPGWCGGNALVLMARGTDSRSIKSLEHVNVDANAQVASNPATLRLVYDASLIAPGQGCIAQTVVAQVASDDDDVEQKLNNGVVRRTDNSLQVPRTNRGQRLGTRFRDIAIPQGSEIIDARIEFTVDRVRNGTARARIFAEDVGDADAFSGNRWELSNRDETRADVTWTMTDSPAVGQTMTTPNIASVVEEVISRADWSSGNALNLMIEPEGNGNRYRQFASYDYQATAAPKLLLRYKGFASVGLGAATVTARSEMLNIIDQLDAYGGTPLVSAHYEAAQYLLGESVDYGRTRGAWWSPRSRYRISHPNSYTGGILYTPPGCTTGDPGDESCKNETINNNPTYISPLDSSCQTTNHVVVLSDGQASSDNVSDKIKDLIDSTDCEDNSYNEACGTDLAKWLYETDHNEFVAESQNITTHTIGFNLNDPRYLKSVAAAGGGGFYPADSADELVAAFEAILNGVQSIDTSFTAPGATVNQFNRLAHREDVYFALFKPTDRPTWNGNLKRYRLGIAEPDANDTGDSSAEGTNILDANGKLAVDEDLGFFYEDVTSFWDNLDSDGNVITTPDGDRVPEGGAAVRIAHDGVANRKLYTYLGEPSDIPNTGIDLTAETHRFHEDNNGIDDVLLGIQGRAAGVAEQAIYRRELMQWVRGMDVHDLDDDGDVTESRGHMGDPMHARPVIVNYRAKSATTDRSVVYVATNEGLLHAIDSETGDELWSFTPAELMENHQLFFENSTSTPHPYGLDGTMTLWREDPNENFVVESADGESVYLYVAMRRGGRNYYAFNITDPDKPKLAWVIQGGANGTVGFEELGQSWSKATHTEMLIGSESRDVLVFGAGYDTNQDPDSNRDANGNAITMSQTIDSQGRGLFVVDAETGELLWSATGPSRGASDASSPDQRFSDMQYSIPADIRVVDIDLDGLADQLYASDMGGQIWRFDVVGDGSTGSDLLQGGVIASLAEDNKDSHRRFYSEPDVALIQQDGERYLSVTIGSGWRAHPLNDIVEDAMYMVKIYDVRAVPEGYGRLDQSGKWVPITEADLVHVNGMESSNADRDLSNGWYLRFPDAGEKVLGTSLIFKNVVYFTTYTPASNVVACEVALGQGHAYALSITDGTPAVDFDNDGVINKTYRSGRSGDMRMELKHKGPPPNAAILIGQDSNGNAADPQVFIGTERIPTDISNETTRTFWVDTGIED